MPPAPGFSELRLNFLKEAADQYGKDTSGEDWEIFILQTVRRFIKRFPVNLGDKQDPTKEFYDAVDDSVVDPKVPMPELGTKEYEDEVVVRKQQANRRKALSKKIYHWLNYHGKNLKTTNKILRSGEGKVTQAIEMRTRLLNGVRLAIPRKSTGPNLWARENPEVVTKLLAQHEVDMKAKQERQAANKGKDQQGATGAAGPSTATPDAGSRIWMNNLATRNSVVTSGFKALPLEEKNEWEQKAIDEARRAKAEYERIVNEPPSEEPSDHQIASSGSIPGHPEMTFSKIKRTAWKENVLPAIAGFLQKVFSPKDCKAWALTTEELAGREDEPIETKDPDDVSRCHLNILGFEAVKAPEVSSVGNDIDSERLDKDKSLSNAVDTGTGKTSKGSSTQQSSKGSAKAKSHQSREASSTDKDKDTGGSAGKVRNKRTRTLRSKDSAKQNGQAKQAVPAPETVSAEMRAELASIALPASSQPHTSTSRPKPTPIPIPTSRRKPTLISAPLPTSTSSSSQQEAVPTRAKSVTRTPTVDPTDTNASASGALSDSLFGLSPPRKRGTAPLTTTEPKESIVASPPRTPILSSPEERVFSPGAAEMSTELGNAACDDMSIGNEANTCMDVDDSSRKRGGDELGQDADASIKPAKRRRGTQGQIEGVRATRSGKKVSLTGRQMRESNKGRKEGQEREGSAADVENEGKGEDKQSSNSNDTTFPALPTGTPEYVRLALELFVTVGVNNSRWMALIRAWLEKEKKAKYKTKLGLSGISKQNRPVAVGMWINRGRKKFDAQIDLNNHAIKFSNWWRTMQPVDRAEDGELDEIDESFHIRYSRDGNWRWEDIFIFGSNGAVSIIAALVWWMEAVSRLKEKAKGKGYWLQEEAQVHEERLTEALSDVYYVFGV
ncbi:hypothetical protein BT96DRAFT_942327 [Gymnopus androsaceus JB14]|uniref:Uncharacterized protein n=1 Tax=Gymnopus androsaceus JB14 TaxID=1447944 RepID=A0A6A4HED4_9AGAR|nr:hypothetical protein BT96DRAFT_942327 [Gymnopus androsaceus JB14]